ncbi:MAG TPA: hypothetical protein VN039_09925 [Nitrospira sp.]|nr:hypothetical protein [Nitrospira sp.]
MAEIKFTAFVNGAVQDSRSDDNFVIKTAEAHRRKVRGGKDDEYETYGRTFRDVFLSVDADKELADWFAGTVFEEGMRIDVIGQEVTRPREYQGKTFYDLVVYATAIAVHEAQAPAKGKAPARRTTARR